ncbi:SDR family NAD(P)-dependent oxidoreductase [Paenibacillus nicotianae]|uniref:SDR family NAD(P)-dependent oxidoreductase n=1 Tax=Paenibacillus nicotianae TaxID=1526551 RepID=UPI00195CAB1B
MNDALSQLYKQIEQGKIDKVEGARQLQQLLSTTIEPSTSPSEQTNYEHVINDNELQDQAVQYLKKLLSSVLMMPERQIEADAPLEKYGIDSIMVMKLTDQLETVFGSLSKTLFFEYHNLQELTEYFLKSHRKSLIQLLNIGKEHHSKTKAEPNQVPIVSTTLQNPKNTRNTKASKDATYSYPNRVAEPADDAITATEQSSSTALDIAIIGLAGRYPEAENISQYWENLKNGKDCITEIPQERWDYKVHTDMQRSSQDTKASGKWGGFIEGVDRFDALFFNISPREAERIDPQERLFLESVYAAIEDAGYTRNNLVPSTNQSKLNKVGVYVGVMYQEYQLYGVESQKSYQEPFALNGNPASIANRVSYYFNFHGPSMVVDTMCSSSLTAIHLACQSLQKQECEVAIAGGVNVSVHPNKYVMLTQGHFLSSKGRCESFGEGGDGYVPGEGVGTAILKPLAKAIADGDHIYGVIKGTAINHGGKTNGYTVPNPHQQAEVIDKAIQESDIDPRSISYIEAHGTGTSLGDPIEIAGLTKMFDRYTSDRSFCAIGSAKSNIGHCESAAGIAGVTKVLLQMKHQKLAPSIHSQPANPNIDFGKTPFVVQHQLDEWKRPVIAIDHVMTEVPLTAGVSSFGAGGSNAHIVIQEYMSATIAKPLATPVQPVMIILSAKNEERLKQIVLHLHHYLTAQTYTDQQLADIAYTLCTGREAMDVRLGIVASSITNLISQLQEYIESDQIPSSMYYGKVQNDLPALPFLSTDEDMTATIQRWIEKRKYSKLLELWVNGIDLNWDIVYATGTFQKISLPTYPFARDRYWVPEVEATHISEKEPMFRSQSMLHPLVHTNTSNMKVQQYTTVFEGNEFFIADHRIGDEHLLPAVTYLEMARAAVEQAISGTEAQGLSISLQQTVWKHPLVIQQVSTFVHIALFPEQENSIRYQIYTHSDDQAELTIHCEGIAIIEDVQIEQPLSDVEQIRAKCAIKEFSADTCYTAYGQLNMHYGERHQTINYLYTGSNECLAHLQLSEELQINSQDYVLHPAIVDGALQASIGIWLGKDDVNQEQKTSLPFALEQIDIYHPTTSAIWAHVYQAEVTQSAISKLNIDLIDQTGVLCVRLQGLTSKAIRYETAMLLSPNWNKQAVTNQVDTQQHQYDQHIIMLCESDSALEQQVAIHFPDAKCISLLPAHLATIDESRLSIDQRFNQLATNAFKEIKHLLQSYKEDRVLIQMVTVRQVSPSSNTALIALLKTATLENPNITTQMIEMQPDIPTAQIMAQLQENQYSTAQQIRYESQQRYIQSDYEQIMIPTNHSHSLWKHRGVYLITGGTGGLGMIFAKEIIEQVEQPIIILTGRAASIDESILYSLQSKEATVIYKQLDLTQQEDVTRLIASITQQYGVLNGIIHSAGMTQDNFIIKKTTEEFNQVLAPKVTGTVNLDLATRLIPLDFFILFSSVASAFGNAGQADYATANAFMDQYAIDRHQQVVARQRSGQTVSFNWGLWVEGGMHIDKETAQFLYRTTGMRPLPTEIGLQLFYAGMASNQFQIITLYGDQAQLSSTLLSRTNAVYTVPTLTNQKVEQEILHIISTILKVDSSELDIETEWSEYGFDQTMLADLSYQLNHNFQLQLTALTFVEYTTIRQLINWIESTIAISPPINTDNIAEQKVVHLPQAESAHVQEQSNSLELATLLYLKQILSSILKLPVEQIEAHAPMEKYGIDSITTLQFTEQLEQTFGRLSKTLLFEYQTLSALATYFIKAHFAILEKQFNTGTAQKSSPSVAQVEHRSTNQRKGTMQQQLPGIHSRFKFAYHTQQPVDKRETDIAIIGLSGRYPQADHLDQYWENLKQGIDCITDIPQNRWRDYSIDGTSSESVTQGGFIDGVDQFDPLFFNISPKEAEMMDPQERLFLQTVYQAIEDAGYTRQTLGASTDSNENNQVGVYVGVMYEEYQLYGAQAQALSQSTVALSGNPASIANRISYFCNFNGPSIAIDTMCSSSLTAIHLACQSLITQECSTAIAGGVNISVHPNKYLMLHQGGFLSSKGRCESFGANGDGYVPGEGVGAVILKPLSAAQADGDHIYGVIKGSAINHGGKTNGYTVPNPVAQSQVIQKAFDRAGVEPRTISYVEAHGTGTSLGDPIEIAGLNAVYQQNTEDKHFCAIGSVKSNIGHCESAAGIAGLTKILLQMKYQQLLPSLHADPLNPNIDFDHIPFVVQKELTEWQRPLLEKDGKQQEIPRRAGLSSFGAGGSNAHLIIEEYTVEPAITASTELSEDDPVLIVLSSKTESQLRIQVQQLLEMLETDLSAYHLQHIAYTLQVGREAMEERLAFVTHSLSDMKMKLTSYLQPATPSHSYPLYRGHTKWHKEMLSMLSSDSGFENMIASWLNHSQYNQLLELWVKGLTINWQLLYSDSQPQRISLPVYPFAKERYWAPDHLLSQRSNLSTSLPEAQEESERTSILYKKHWQTSPIADLLHPELILPSDRKVVILTNDQTGNLGKHVASSIPNSLIWHENGLEYQLESTDEQVRAVASLIDLTGWTNDFDNSNVRYTLHKGWLQWLQRWIEINQKTPITLLQVTKGLESFQNTAIHLQGAERVGLYRMLQHEYAHVRSRHIDFDQHATEESTALTIAQELFLDSPDVEVCYRSDQRWVAYLKAVENMPDFAAVPAQKRSLHQEQVLWITGGTRGLGMLCAQHFVTQYGVKKLVLSGQEALPPKEEWHLYNHQHSRLAEKIRSIVQLEQQGVQVYVTSVDLTSIQEVQKVIAEVHSQLGSIGGVIHCAGTADQINPAFIRKNVESVESVLNPKIQGLHTLYQCLQQEPLQFWVLFSSVAAIIPSLSVGQSDYAIANAYMDYFAEAYSDSYPIYSIQWPSWKETGFGEVKSKRYEQTGLLSMTNKEGLQLLDYILSTSQDNVILPAVMNKEIAQPSVWMKYQQPVRSDQLISEPTIQSADMSASSIAIPESDELHEMTLNWLTELIAKELKVDVARLDDRTPFAEYGIDSILLAQIITTLDRTLQGTAVDPTMMLEYPTIQQLAEQLVYTYPLELVTLFTNDRTVEPIVNSSPPIVEKAQDVYKPALEKQQKRKQKIAVIGIGCHFPDADDPLQFWHNLKSGKDSIQKAPASRQNHQSDGAYNSIDTVRYGAFLANIEEFDPAYFGISESLAMQIDPLQRQLLEVSVEAATDAGYTKKQLSNTQTGVFVGSRTSNYSSKVNRTAKDTIVGIGQNFIAAHLAHFYNLKGPNLVVDTACSSSLTAIHLAVQSIQNGECELAFAGGVDILLDEVPFETLGSANVLSTDSRCKTFSADADGIGLGEGCGVVILKPLDQAIADQDRIYGVIDGSALNNDGNTMGITTPNPEAQKELVYKAVQNADIDPSTISYIETHGTGTLIGDPIELKALTSVFSDVTDRQQFCGVGSVKSNIGHLLSAAGVASFIKVLLSLVHEELPPTIHCDVPNPRFRFEQSPFYIVQQHQKWSHKQGILRAGISAFGLGGNNAHILVSNEGIPTAYRRSLPLSYTNIGFDRQRYWPTDSKEYAKSEVLSSVVTSDFFDVIKVGEGSE